MKYYLLTQRTNWADEINFEGFLIVEAENEEDAFKAIISRNQKFPCIVSVGSNEEIEFKTKEAYLRTFRVKEISEEEYDVIGKVLGGSFGKLLTLDCDEEEEEV